MKTKPNICTKKMMDKTQPILTYDNMMFKYIRTHKCMLIYK